MPGIRPHLFPTVALIRLPTQFRFLVRPQLLSRISISPPGEARPWSTLRFLSSTPQRVLGEFPPGATAWSDRTAPQH
jgi:hypothetical protein